MDIDFEGARGSFAFSSKGKPGHDGTAGNLKITIKAAVNAKPEFVDKYLDGHLSGAQPTSVLWRELAPGEKHDVVPRYMYLKSMELEVSEDRRYGFRFRKPRPEGLDGPEKGFMGYREVVLLPTEIKKVKVSPAANGCVVHLTIVAENQRPEISSALSELVVLEEIVLDGWLVDRDLPLGEDGDDEDDEDQDDDDSDEDDDSDDEDADEDEEDTETAPE
jgi:hypothetical protein